MGSQESPYHGQHRGLPTTIAEQQYFEDASGTLTNYYGRDAGRERTRSSGKRERNYYYKGQRRVQDLNSIVDYDDGGRSESTGCRNKENKHHEGFKALENLTEYPPDDVIVELISMGSRFSMLLQEEDISPDNFDLLIQVLAHVTLSHSNKESMYDLFNRTCDKKFIDRLAFHAVTVKRKYPDRAQNFFTNLIKFLASFAGAMITIAVDRLPNSIEIFLPVLVYLKQSNHVSANLVKEYENLQEMLKDAVKSWEHDQELGSKKWKEKNVDHQHPPENFRTISVLPTTEDIFQIGLPFLRKNILNGKYKNGGHYLDVQFRLYREDFVRPLRNGINDFLSDSHNRIRDVRIYRGVTINRHHIVGHKVYNTVNINQRMTMKFEHSKRLLFGNLLCFSKDNFQTLFLGSVADRDLDKLKAGMLGVEFVSDIDSEDLSGEFVMLESRAYFMAYKHVLMALQNIPEDAIPLEPYIVHVQPNVDLPQYLRAFPGVNYDLRVMKSSMMMKQSEAGESYFSRQGKMKSVGKWNSLKEVSIHKDLCEWPTSADLGLDDSQRRALRNALTRQLAIVQGPPGTGKTFLGLKIVQTLLHNSSAWKVKCHEAPILVVCYTNHALDQFLVGITNYTCNILRVGSRTKNEIISQYQISSKVQNRCSLPDTIFAEKKALYGKLNVLKDEMQSLEVVENACKVFNGTGIIPLNLLVEGNVIPQHVQLQLQEKSCNAKLSDWLFSNVKQPTTITPDNQMMVVQSNSYQQVSTEGGASSVSIQKEKVAHDSSQDDVEELLEMHERDRILEVDSDIMFPSLRLKVDNWNYEVTDEELAEEMKLLLDVYRTTLDPDAKLKYEVVAGQRELLQLGLHLPEMHDRTRELEKDMKLNIWKLEFPDRWQLYKYWVQKLGEKAKKKLTILTQDYKNASKSLDENRKQEHLYLMRKASIVGMTTTGAAQYNRVLQDLAPPIVVIEEAAEILESHVLTTLSANCQHLIMIGDHQQLRPSATVFELATKYGLDTSMFERMIKNGMTYDTLEYQHRMRPNISKLLVPSVYPKLKDDPSVHKFPSIKGITKDVFFLSHQINEKEEADDNNSHENLHEAEFLVGLCRHLMLQGYSPDDVTILTPYTGQFFLLRKLQRKEEACKGVKICVVDNFQGEENKIILLSLVRSNLEGKVGFLQTENRVCVALSRAQHGLYIVGNISLLSTSSKLWKTIQDDLTNMKSIGDSLTLQCCNHPQQVMTVSTGEDFYRKCPRGGCQEVCDRSLPLCNHSCSEVCHMDDLEHIEYKCQVPCPKKLCALDHQCPKLCWEYCEPCKVLVKKKLPCGHRHKFECHIPPESFDCPTSVTKELPCQHMGSMLCHENPEEFSCTFDCDTRLDCGHKCRQSCHLMKDPEHIEYECNENCTKFNAGCTKNHPCLKKCHEVCGACIFKVSKILPCHHEVLDVECSKPVENIRCTKKCRQTLSCGHPCKKMCDQECGDCRVKVKKMVPECHHDVWMECCQPATPDNCDGRCPKMLKCGHPCTSRCQDQCTDQCTELVKSTTRCPKGHNIKLPCHLANKVEGENAWPYCREPCDKVLDCEHTCVGDCGHCFQGRLHVSCSRPCKKPLVCGHICKQSCIANCLPCQETCQWSCDHRKCNKACGTPCIPCKEPCSWKCEHLKCDKLCGDKCSRQPCEQPCKKTVKKCGHPCIGFCGEPCPPLCRECDEEEVFGCDEELDADARFVLMEDCGHIIESKSLKNWMEIETAEIGMKKCPKCQQTIFNNRHHQHIIIKTYEMVKKVKTKYNISSKKSSITRKSIESVVLDPTFVFYWPSHAKKLTLALGMGLKDKPQRQKYLSDGELRLLMFQAQVIKKAANIQQFYKEKDKTVLAGTELPHFLSSEPTSQNMECLKAKIETVLDRVMDEKATVAPQMMWEVSCEMQRLMVLPASWKLQEKLVNRDDKAAVEIQAELTRLFDPTIVFNEEIENRFCELLKEAENYLGAFDVCDSERIAVLKAVGLKQGQWHKCPSGHAYCITECVGAVNKTQCPLCNPEKRVGNRPLLVPAVSRGGRDPE